MLCLSGGVSDKLPLLSVVHSGQEKDPEPEKPGGLASAQYYPPPYLDKAETELGLFREPQGGRDHFRLTCQFQRAL